MSAVLTRSRPCWKCNGSGCVVCSQRGVLEGRRRSVSAGRVSRGPSPGDENYVGPAPAGGDSPKDGEDLCCLSGRWRIFQRQGGHRYSTEDVVTAAVAIGVLQEEATTTTTTGPTERRTTTRHVDLGCGVGSVLLFVAWAAARAGLPYRGVGIEAQEDSAGLARRSIRWNGVSASLDVVGGDFRDDEKILQLDLEKDGFLLVTGTPPYFPVDAGAYSTSYGSLPSCDESAKARYEFRGGVDAYCRAAARLLRGRPQRGRFVCCEGGLPLNRDRVAEAARRSGLRILRSRLVVGRQGKPALFGVWVMMASSAASEQEEEVLPPLVVRDRHGQRTPEYVTLLRNMAMLNNSSAVTTPSSPRE